MAESGKPNETTADTTEDASPSRQRGRSSSRKRPLSNSDDLMKPPATRHRSQSVSRQSVESDPVTFKTQGQTYNFTQLVETT